MLASLKKRVRETDAVPPTMEGPQSSTSLQDPSPSLLEVPEESIPREPLGNPRTESLDTEMILQHFRESQAGQDSLLSEMAELRTSIGQMNRWFKEAESRFSSLEAGARESQQTNQIVPASQSEPRAVPAASSSSFSNQQMILDAAQMAASPGCASVYTGGTSTEPAPPPSSEQFRTTSSTMMYSETEEKAYQMLANAWSQERNFESERARIEAEESGNQGDTSSGLSPLISSECKTDPETLTSTEERALPMITAVYSLERISESETAHIQAEEFGNKEDTYARASPLMASECKTEPETLTSTEEAARPVIPAECFSESQTANTWAEETDQLEDTFSRAMPSLAPEYERDPHPWMSTEEEALPMIPDECFLERISESEIGLTKAEETDHQEDTFFRAMPSLAPEYETDPQPSISTEEAALAIIAAVGLQEAIAENETAHTEPEESDREEDNFSGGSPQAYKPQQPPLTSTLSEIPQPTALAVMQKEAPGRATQSSRRRSTHKRSSSAAFTRTPTKHRRTSMVWLYFRSQSRFKATCSLCGMNVQTGKIGGCSNVGTAALLSHLERKHGITQKKVAPSGLPAACSTIQEVERPSTTERSSRTKPRWASLAWLYFTSQSKLLATCNLCKEDVQFGKTGGCGTGGTVALLRHLKCEHGIPQEKVEPPEMPGGGSKTQDVNRPSSTERPSRTTLLASVSTATPPGTLSCPSSSPPADIRPPTKRRRRRSVAWKYFTKQSKFMATCNLCKEDVQVGKIGGCGNVGTTVLFRHLKRKHGIPQEKVASSVLPGGGSKNQDVNRLSTKCRYPSTSRLSTKCRQTSIAWQYFTKRSEFIATCGLCKTDLKTGKEGGSHWGTVTLLAHLKRMHGIAQNKVAPSVFHGAGSEIQDAKRPSSTERPSRTTLVASAFTASSPGTLRGISSSPPADVKPPTKRRRRTSIAWQYFMKQSKFMATCNLCEKNVQTGTVEGNWGTGALLRHLKREHGIPQEKVAPSVLPGGGSKNQDVNRLSTTERPNRTILVASASTVTSPETLRGLSSSDVRPPTKCGRRTSIAWKYVTKRSRFMATCSLCEEDVQIGNIGSNWGTVGLLRHLKRKHGVHREKVAQSVSPRAESEIQDVKGPSTTERPSRTTSAASTCTASSSGTLSCHSSSPPPTKRQRRRSIAWKYFMKLSKFIAICNLCEEEVQIGKIGGCGKLGTAALLSHLKRIHHNVLKKRGVTAGQPF